MDKQAQMALIDQVIEEVEQRYAIEKMPLHFLGGFLNRAYEYEKAGRHYIVRISFESRRTVEMIQGEMDWLRYLGGMASAQVFYNTFLAGYHAMNNLISMLAGCARFPIS